MRLRRVKPFLLALAGAPALWLWFAALTDRLGANPAEALIRGLGEWTLIMLCLTLSITPLRQWTGRPEWALLRRGLGLWSFAYAVQHFTVYLWLDMEWGLAQTWADVLQRPFILVGSLAVLLMLPLAATSFNGAVKRLGATRWKRLHASVHLIAALALLHFFWMRSGKSDYADVLFFALVLSLLWALRLLRRWKKSGSQTSSPS
ncbi:MAG TPA: protein-methionine-sulfoxide reductase heme-binding subunit MsrQ [Hydrogenophaga sp.]|uniref:sulfite oxidase heme-binding subunit YedZ n=1 Tax=Hydrogenophaga sp. TaxID=1904254 RepID=UPI002C42FD3D|nr:protein-methionine-sulfoxide reductase heme-binding subunit MsrQ [Hydrogenophaga sp.]HMN91881.1 protein-methionine-sulfoxide reductase heme-binding subunit MsrQ [Hydrogenophaga sp.]HMP08979.1 protein-methionine-sulfoxide reductase heme-binding subunit MsrQ [Hydrogenophaga sp.]